MQSPTFGDGFPPMPANLRRVARRPPLSETPKVAGERFLFLGGLHKSGTSILHRLLRAHPDTSGLFNTGFPQDEGQLVQTEKRNGAMFDFVINVSSLNRGQYIIQTIQKDHQRCGMHHGSEDV